MVGQPNEVYGEVVTAIVVPRNQGSGQSMGSRSDELIADVQHFLNARMAMYKQPRQYHVVDTIPRNLMGKV